MSRKIRGITYTPDFVNEKDRWIIECKGLRTEAFNLRWKMFKNILAKKKKFYDLYMPGTKTQVLEVVQLIKQKYKEC